MVSKGFLRVARDQGNEEVVGGWLCKDFMGGEAVTKASAWDWKILLPLNLDGVEFEIHSQMLRAVQHIKGSW